MHGLYLAIRRKVCFQWHPVQLKVPIYDKGFGFISVDGSRNNEVFFHSSAVVDGTFDALQVGQTVTFEQEPDPRNPSRSRAKDVRVSDAGAES